MNSICSISKSDIPVIQNTKTSKIFVWLWMRKLMKNSHFSFYSKISFCNSFILEINHQYKNPALKMFRGEDVENHGTYDSNLYDYIKIFLMITMTVCVNTFVYPSIFFHRMIRLKICIQPQPLLQKIHANIFQIVYFDGIAVSTILRYYVTRLIPNQFLEWFSLNYIKFRLQYSLRSPSLLSLSLSQHIYV